MTRSIDKFHSFLKHKLREAEEKEREARTTWRENHKRITYSFCMQYINEQLQLMKIIHEYARFKQAEKQAGRQSEVVE